MNIKKYLKPPTSYQKVDGWKGTLPKFNMEPKKDGFQKDSPIPGCHFQVNHVKIWKGPAFFFRVSQVLGILLEVSSFEGILLVKIPDI